MARLYLAVGHGLRSTGLFDPGAVNGADGSHEYDLAFAVVGRAHAAFTRSALEHDTETDGGPGHDPDYIGSVKKVNAGKYSAALEVHFDSANAPAGGFGIYASETSSGKAWAQQVRNRWGQAGLPQRSNYADRRGLHFLQKTRCPALIWECDRTAVHDPGELTRMGEAIARGTCEWLGVPYVAPGAEPVPVPPPPPLFVDYPGDKMKRIDLSILPHLDGSGGGHSDVPGVANAADIVSVVFNGSEDPNLAPPPKWERYQEGTAARIRWRDGAPNANWDFSVFVATG